MACALRACVCVCKLPFFLPGATAHGCASAARSSTILRGPCPARVLQGSACCWLWPRSRSFEADCAGACMDFACRLCSQAFLACLGVRKACVGCFLLCSQEAAALRRMLYVRACTWPLGCVATTLLLAKLALSMFKPALAVLSYAQLRKFVVCVQVELGLVARRGFCTEPPPKGVWQASHLLKHATICDFILWKRWILTRR